MKQKITVNYLYYTLVSFNCDLFLGGCGRVWKCLVDDEGDLPLACNGVAGVFSVCSSSRLISLPDL